MAEKAAILHLITPNKNASPFDVNMAIDAGFAHIIPYTEIAPEEVVALTQDAMFSRSPSGVKREALFFGGRDIHAALQMQSFAQNAMFPPFVMSTMADPSGAFTTAAAMVAKIQQQLTKQQQVLSGQVVAIFGAGGTVGLTAALILAEQGAEVLMVAHRDVAQMQAVSRYLKETYQAQTEAVDGVTDAAKTAVLARATIAISAAAAGVRVVSLEHIRSAKQLRVMADVNAVPPSGIEGVSAMSDGEPAGNALGIGALAIGQLKYGTQHAMLKQLLSAAQPVHLAYRQAYQVACGLL